jgi:fructosamine-3-kinase
MNGSWRKVEQQLGKTQKNTLHFTSKENISGGCINQAWKLTDSTGKEYFIKTNSVTLKDMFSAEASGLIEIEKSKTIRSPKVLAHGNTTTFSYLALEYIPFHSQINQQKMGQQLAQMHQFLNSKKLYGWNRDNYIGSTPQTNQYHSDWIEFWKSQRLLFQLNLAQAKGYSNSAYDNGLKLVDSLEVFFSNYHPTSSLLHGDLWGGNCANDASTNSVIYDPAVYYGDRETDIAMTELFGGFSNDFYAAYNNSYTLDSGYKTRKTLYNLYHILNHYNLFGGGYAKQAENMTIQLLSEI